MAADDRDIGSIAALIPTGDREGRLLVRLRLRQDILELRLDSSRLRATERVADAIAKIGGGSLLTTTIGLVVARQPLATVIAVGGLTLLFLVAGIILSAWMTHHALGLEFEADKIDVALAEVYDDDR